MHYFVACWCGTSFCYGAPLQVEDAELARDRALRAAAEADNELQSLRASADQEMERGRAELNNVKDEHKSLSETVSALYKERDLLRVEVERSHIHNEKERQVSLLTHVTHTWVMCGFISTVIFASPVSLGDCHGAADLIRR